MRVIQQQKAAVSQTHDPGTEALAEPSQKGLAQLGFQTFAGVSDSLPTLSGGTAADPLGDGSHGETVRGHGLRGPLVASRSDGPAQPQPTTMTGPVVTPLRRSLSDAPVLRREPTVKERRAQYEKTAADSGKAFTGAPKQAATGIGPAAFAQRSEAFSGTGPAREPATAARPTVQGLPAGSVGRLAERIGDRGGAEEQLIREAGSDWAAVKERYVKDVPTMESLVAYRKRFVDGLIDDLRRDDRRFTSMSTRAAGSTALTSDYDITFLGINGAAAVQEFNMRFRKYWGKEAGTIFDTNVYAEDVLPSKKQVQEGDHDLAHLGDTSGAMNIDARLDEGLQDVSSLVKVRKNMRRGDWFAFVDTILARLGRDRSTVQEAASRFADANTIYERTMVPEILQQVAGTEAGAGELAKLRKRGVTTEVALVEEIMKVNEGTAASNRVYEAKLLVAADLERRRDEEKNPTKKKTLTVDLRKAKADAMLFANEPYFSAGTLFHVVGNIQAGFGATLTSAAHFQSLQENYGDTLKELHHLHGKEWKVVAIKASKYVWRVFDAAVEMVKAGVDVAGGLDLAALHGAAKKALDVRQGKAGADESAALAALETAGIANEAQLSAVLRTLVTAANVAVRSGQPDGGTASAGKAGEGAESESTEG